MNLTTDDLRAVLAERAGPPPTNLRREHEIERRLVRRRRRRIAGSAGSALAAAAAAAAVTLVLPNLGPAGERPPAAGRGKPQPLPPPAVVPIERAAPQAVHTLPDRLPGGARYEPEFFLDERTLIVVGKKFWKPVRDERIPVSDGSIWRFDLETKKATRLSSRYGGGFFQDTVPFIVVNGMLIWHVEKLLGRPETKRVVDVWAAPLAGGKTRRIGGVTTPFKQVIGRAGDSAALSGVDVASQSLVLTAGYAGIYRIPLAGGKAQLIPGTTGKYVLSWPWAGSFGPQGDLTMPDDRTLVNVVTGERRVARLPGEPADWSCSLSWCVYDRLVATSGRRPRGPSQLVVQARDGSKARLWRTAPMIVGPIVRDRFLKVVRAGSRGARTTFYDLEQNRLLDLGNQLQRGGGLSRGDLETFHPVNEGTVYYEPHGDGELRVVNLDAVR